MTKKVLFISNGKGEDSIAVTIIEQLKKITPNFQIEAISLIGNADAYQQINIKVLKTWGNLPNEGFFSFLSIIFHFGKLLRRLISQAKLLANINNNYDLVICVGDFYTVFLAVITKCKAVHIATAMTNYIRPFNAIEKWVFKNKLRFVFTRDEITAKDLLANQIKASYYGNPMMDDKNLLAPKENKLLLSNKKKNVMLIPSSRNDAYKNLRSMAHYIYKMKFQDNIFYFTSIHPRLQMDLFIKELNKDGWHFVTKNDVFIKGVFQKKDCNDITVLTGSFRELLESTQIAIGMTGTGNEQVVGLGVPLILLKGKSKSSSNKRLQHYKKLLGEAVFIPKFWKKQLAILEVIQSNTLQKKMRAVGLTRMGKAGGSRQIAFKIKELIYS